jgi:hypothetical protein
VDRQILKIRNKSIHIQIIQIYIQRGRERGERERLISEKSVGERERRRDGERRRRHRRHR